VPTKVPVNAVLVFNLAPVPSGSGKSIDQAVPRNWEVVSYALSAEFHKETVVPSGTLGSTALRLFEVAISAMWKRLSPG